MTDLSDLTTRRLAALYGALTGAETGPKTFNTKQKAIARIEALLAERNLTVADALKAGGFDTETPDAEEPVEPMQEEPAVPEEPQAVEPDDTAAGEPVALAGAFTEAADAATILTDPAIIADIHQRLTGILTGHGLDSETATAAAERAIAALKPPVTKRTRTPRTDTKQEQVIALLRRPEGATIAEIANRTGWKRHTVRGFFAGALKKKLGLAVISDKSELRGRFYRLPAAPVAEA
jgi:hypothetical protein